MGTPESEAAVESEKPAVEQGAESVPSSSDQVPPERSDPPRQRGLWGMMGQAPEAIDAAVAATSASTEAVAEESRPELERSAPPSSTRDSRASAPAEPRRGLFALMHGATEETAEVTGQAEPGADNVEDIDSSSNIESSDVEPDHADNEDRGSELDFSNRPDPSPLALDVEELGQVKYRTAAINGRRQAKASFYLGLLAVSASALSLMPNVLLGLPATAAGFTAIILGYLAITGPGRREMSGAAQAFPIFGMLLGTAGIFLGPLLFANIGRTLREGTGQQATIQHLTQIGDGLDQHYQKHDGYPIGGTFARNAAGGIQGQHGWMTFLLPFVGEAELYQEVDQSKPFDDLLNRKPMGRNVTVYLAAGGDRSRVGQGYGATHFAGVGGEINESNRLSHLGIFERDVAVKRDEITDGLSNTLIVGELAGAYPPWGSPENWRKTGRGLNRDPDGFGSHNKNGASFLLADGVVKFFNNNTDPKLLEKMATRDGGE